MKVITQLFCTILMALGAGLIANVFDWPALAGLGLYALVWGAAMMAAGDQS